MVCPNCGRTIEVGEICQCQALDVARRDSELAQEATDNREQKRAEREKKTKEKSEKMQAASQKADAAVDSAMNFGKRMLECFKHIDKVDDLYIKAEETKTALILLGIHTILNILLVYMALTTSPIGLLFAVASVFNVRVSSALIIGAFSISILPMLAKLGVMKYVVDDKCLMEVSSEYIFTIPAAAVSLIVMLVSPTIGLAFVFAIIVFGFEWTAGRLRKNGINKDKSLIAVTIMAFAICMLAIIVCKLIA